MSTRGINNNNPLNIRIVTNQNWLGKKTPNTDVSFEQFQSPEYGIRAGLLLLLNYKYKYNKDTISEIIETFAPSSENDTQSYINFVSNRTKIDKNKVLDIFDYKEVIKAMIFQENSFEYSDYDQLFDKAVLLLPNYYKILFSKKKKEITGLVILGIIAAYLIYRNIKK